VLFKHNKNPRFLPYLLQLVDGKTGQIFTIPDLFRFKILTDNKLKEAAKFGN